MHNRNTSEKKRENGLLRSIEKQKQKYQLIIQNFKKSLVQASVNETRRIF